MSSKLGSINLVIAQAWSLSQVKSMNGRWYGDKDPPTTCFVERKTHRESWKGEESVKERFTLPEDRMVPYLEGEYTLQQAQRDLKAKARPCFLHIEGHTA